MAQFGGSMLGVWGSSSLMTRRHHRISLMFGLALMAWGSVMLLAATWVSGIFATFTFGVGLGFTIPTTNLLVSELNPEKRAASLSLVNFSWTIGAAVSPFLISAMLRAHRSSHLLYGVAAMLVLVALSLTRVSFPDIASASENADRKMPVSLWRSRWVPILGALFFLYVGTEAGLGGWTATYARRIESGAGTMWILMPSFFWAALLLGRLIAPLLLRTVRELTLAKYGLALSTVGVAGLLAARNLSVVALAIALAGLGLSSIFPIAIATLSRKFGAGASRIAGVMFALAGAGGATLPWLIGYTSTVSGNLKYGLLVPLASSVIMLLLNVFLAKPE
ncbi:MAG: transporter, major facilitator family [Candidatus Sulfotelmatobacter sp.]|nr:transporter, major facilitator family [Candidatus Sulfotelmatobacter sp.]